MKYLAIILVICVVPPNIVGGMDTILATCKDNAAGTYLYMKSGLTSHVYTCVLDRAFLARCSNQKVQARLPPTVAPNTSLFSSWVAPPPGWFYGNWKVTYTSQPAYFPFHNFQWDSSPLFPQSTGLPGQNNDLTSYQLANDSTVVTAYGIDTPRRSNDPSLGPEWDSVYDFDGTGALASVNNSWELLAWGYDTCGDAYTIIYETPVVAINSLSGLDIDSRSEHRPSPKTLEGIYDALTHLNNTELTELVRTTRKLVVDGRRTELPPVECDARCVDNTNLPP